MDLIESATKQIEGKVRALLSQPITLQARKGPDDRLEIPVSATCMFALTFSMLELREMGVEVHVATPDGRIMSDDELAAAILHADKHE